ncbi:helix-turn-helix transcriptional regulator [Luteimonas aquatica]|uniref:helix-turn-helix transcriptional regulator n=1 Tax=Luteimonas aquatica TaxID=450364 RepID=UPI001F59BE7D|nr:helix-turn-helix transcriptional regulator [Luteimonas aquatica]
MGRKISKPEPDRRHLQQIIAGLSDGVLVIDPGGSIAWANDSALASHGVRKRADLGATVKDYRRNFVLAYRNHRKLLAGQYPAEKLLSGDQIDDVIVHVRKKSDADFERVHQVRGITLADADGATESLVLVIKDLTDQYNANERFERAFDANPAPALICALSDLRYIKVNRGFREMTGIPADSILGRHLYDLDVLNNAEHRDDAISSLKEGTTILQQEATVKVGSGVLKHVIVAGQPIEVDDQPCMLFTFIDLDQRKRLENSLRENEERFSKAFRLAPVPMLVFSHDDDSILEVNDAFTAMTGLSTDELSAAPATSFESLFGAADRSRIGMLIASQAGARNVEIRLHSKLGASLDCLVSIEQIIIGEKICSLVLLQDVTERKRTEADIAAAMEAVMKDATWFSRTVMEKLAQIKQSSETRSSGAGISELTARELEILTLVAGGHADTEIATSLGLSRNTIRNHLSAIYAKIGAHRRSAAIIWARERGLGLKQ